MATMGGGSKRQPFKIWLTDYETFDITYDCRNLASGLMKYETFSVSTRDPVASKSTLRKVNDVLKSKLPQYTLDHTDLYFTK